MATCYDSYGRRYYCRSSWSDWGRWVALGVILVVAFLLFFCCAYVWSLLVTSRHCLLIALNRCISQRRRRKAGRQPYYGTGWTYHVPGGGNGQTYNPQQNYQPPPQYNQAQYDGAPQGGYYGQNQSYFGGQRNDMEMQPPQNVYQNTGSSYAPPSGPPPNKY